MAREMLGRFHADHPDIHVFYTPDPDDYVTRMPTDMVSGIAADVFQGCCTHFPAWAQMGHTLDLRPYVERDLDSETIADWDPAQYQALITRDGLQFGLPKYHGALVLYYNKDLFDEQGVAYPDASWDHDSYLAAMRRLTHDRDGDGTLDQWGSAIDVSWDRIQVHVNAWGGHFVDPEDPTHSCMADSEALEAMEWLRARMWRDQVMATPLNLKDQSVTSAFIAGQIAMVEDGSWSLRQILEQADFRFGVAPLPAGPKRRVTLSSTDGFGIYSGTQHPEQAWELLKFLISPSYGRAMAEAAYLQPARNSLVEEWQSLIHENFPQQSRELDLAVFAEGQRQGYSVVAEIFPNMQEAKRLAEEAWDRIYTLGIDGIETIIATSEKIENAQQSEQ
jgi:multiple sugar transport system substrate-binding protein